MVTEPAACLANRPVSKRMVRFASTGLAAAADELQQSPTGVVVVLVLLEVLGQVADPLAQQRDLHLRRTGVTVDRGVLRHDGLLGGGIESHVVVPPVHWCAPGSSSPGQVD